MKNSKNRKPSIFHKLHDVLVGYMARSGLLLTAIPMTADTLESIPEAQRSLYVPHGDKFRLDVDGVEDTAGLKSALEKERLANKTSTRQAAQWASLGKTPEEITELVEAQAQAERDKLTKGGEWDKLKSQMSDQQKVELGKKDDRIGALTKSLERRLVDADATAAIAAAKGVPALLLPHVRAQVRVIEDGGEFKAQVVDAQGNPRVNGKGEFLSIGDLVAEMRDDAIFGRAFEPTGTAGSGAQGGGSGGNGKTITQTAFDALPPKGRAAAMASGMRVV